MFLDTFGHPSVIVYHLVFLSFFFLTKEKKNQGAKNMAAEQQLGIFLCQESEYKSPLRQHVKKDLMGF